MLDQRSLAHAPRTLDNEILSRLGEFLELALKLGPWAEVLPGDNTSIFKRVYARNIQKCAAQIKAENCALLRSADPPIRRQRGNQNVAPEYLGTANRTFSNTLPSFRKGRSAIRYVGRNDVAAFNAHNATHAAQSTDLRRGHSLDILPRQVRHLRHTGENLNQTADPLTLS